MQTVTYSINRHPYAAFRRVCFVYRCAYGAHPLARLAHPLVLLAHPLARLAHRCASMPQACAMAVYHKANDKEKR